MNALVKKEIRLLLPNFLFAGVLALAGLFFQNNTSSLLDGILAFTCFVLCPAAAVMLVLSPFGGEVSAGTFANLLAQPVPRLKIWETKIALLTVALVALTFLWTACFALQTSITQTSLAPRNTLDLVSAVIPFGLAIFSGGLWTVLLLRQVAAAFWFTLLVPGAILTVLAAVFGEHDANFFQGVVVTSMGLYSLAGFFFARRLFLRAQDLQWSGGTIVMPEIGKSKYAGERRVWRPCAALWRKELMLHQSHFVVAFVLLVLHLGVLAVRHFADLSNSKDIKFILEVFWGLWLALPFLVGCTAVAEERKLGTLDSQLVLPAKRRAQFLIKFVVAIGLSLIFGMVMPLVLEGERILPSVHWEIGALQPGWEHTLTSSQKNLLHLLETIRNATPLLTFAFISCAVCFVAFYISSLARNTLQTLAPAVLGIMVAWMLVLGSFAAWNYYYDFLWHGPIGFLIGLPVIAIAVLWLSFKNFQKPRPDARNMAANFAMFLLALVIGIFVTSATYHRFWEKFSRFEPPHGAARLTLANPAKLEMQAGDFSVRLPDNRIWRSWWEHDERINNPITRLFGNFTAKMAPGKFFAETNWLAIRRGHEIVGIKMDGTLWISEVPQIDTVKNNRQWKINRDAMDRMVQFGTETNWSSLAVVGSIYALMTKSDGTLWQWGERNFNTTKTNWPGLRAFAPRRLGKESNWAEISQGSYKMVFYKMDGSGWITDGNWDTNYTQQIQLENDFVLHTAPPLRRGVFVSRVDFWHRLSFLAGIATNGTFRIFADEHIQSGSHKNYRYYGFTPADYQIGNETNWLAAVGGGEKVVTLKNDGTLWLWDFRTRGTVPGAVEWDGKTFAPEIQRTVPVQLGTHADWIAIAGYSHEMVALAADGSLWYWPLASPGNFFNNEGIVPLLDISRKPQLLGNVFAEAR